MIIAFLLYPSGTYALSGHNREEKKLQNKMCRIEKSFASWRITQFAQNWYGNLGANSRTLHEKALKGILIYYLF